MRYFIICSNYLFHGSFAEVLSLGYHYWWFNRQKCLSFKNIEYFKILKKKKEKKRGKP